MAAALILALLAAAAPAFARLSEDLWGLAPCALCLWQRWPYWAAAGFASAAAALPRARRPLLALAGAAVLASGAVAGFHMGVEAGWWPSPLAGCQAAALPAAAGIEDLLRSMPVAPSKPCDAPTYLVPGLPLSMAAMNLLYALGLGGFVLIWAGRGAAKR
ncbi:MAG: disulfide bond formation protein B [Acetobacteraceae bacterium]|nr:disulfide bond formation protein B [Acetobacteraceae bacterium]